MTRLVKAADCAFPFDYSILPDDVTVILGYVGEYGNTPHIWSTQEVTAARDTGRIWCPIWVTPQRGLVQADGVHAARGMVAALVQYRHPKHLPVFLDIEYASYHANPVGAMGAVQAWQFGMAAAGWQNAIAYLPKEAGAGWIADWTGVDPTSLPVGWRGEQYAGNVDHGRYDLSEFDPTLFHAPVGDDEMALFDGHALTDAEKAQRDRLAEFIQANAREGVRGFFLDPHEQGTDGKPLINPANGKPYGAHSILTLCQRAAAAALKQAGGAAGGGTVNETQLAHELAAALHFQVTATVTAPSDSGAHAATS